MTSSNVAPQKRTEQDHTWRILIELAFPGEWTDSSLATDLVTGVVETLNWSVENLEQLKRALVQTTRNTIDRRHVHGSEGLLIIRVLILEDDDVLQEAGLADDASSQRQTSKRIVQEASRSPSCGWGFFLVNKQVDAPPVLTKKPHHLIELFLYQESHGLSRR